MRDTKFFNKPNLFSGIGTYQVTERGLTWKRRFAICFWLLLLVALAFITSVCFAMFDSGIEWYVQVNIRVYANFRDSAHTANMFRIPLVDWGRYFLSIPTVMVGLMSLKAMFIHPRLNSATVRVHPTQISDEHR